MCDFIGYKIKGKLRVKKIVEAEALEEHELEKVQSKSVELNRMPWMA
ncbi:MAG: hypothetical protein WA667_19085 [Candidatus Nitrosopolaris sp.]